MQKKKKFCAQSSWKQIWGKRVVGKELVTRIQWDVSLQSQDGGTSELKKDGIIIKVIQALKHTQFNYNEPRHSIIGLFSIVCCTHSLMLKHHYPSFWRQTTSCLRPPNLFGPPLVWQPSTPFDYGDHEPLHVARAHRRVAAVVFLSLSPAII